MNLSSVGGDIVISAAAVIVALIVAVNNYRLTHDKLFQELFIGFNARYDKLNGELERLWKANHLHGYDPELEGHTFLHDYLNLCAEEYYWYRRGRIPPEVWQAWYEGMRAWYNELEALRKIWSMIGEQKQANSPIASYYVMSPSFFDNFGRRRPWFLRLFKT